MFLHILRYGTKTLLRERQSLFWSLGFPFILTTFMYLAFGDIFESTEKFEVIPVAVVQEEENSILNQVLQELSKEGEDQMLDITWTDEKEAREMLKEKEITGIIYEKDDGKLVVRESGIPESILQMMLGRIKQETAVMQEISQEQPQNLEQVLQTVQQDVEFCEKKASGSGNQDYYVNYFYAIFAMACLFASFSSLDRIQWTQADSSALGARRCVAPVPKRVLLITEFLMGETIQFGLVVLLFLYQKFVLHIQIGDDYAAIALLLLVGTSLGTILGMFVGALPRLSEATRVAILVAVSLLLCMLSDLMIAGIRDWIEHRIPIINDINPAALICDSFYALNVYDNYERFTWNILLLALITVVLGVVSYLMVRRDQYASL